MSPERLKQEYSVLCQFHAPSGHKAIGEMVVPLAPYFPLFSPRANPGHWVLQLHVDSMGPNTSVIRMSEASSGLTLAHTV